MNQDTKQQGARGPKPGTGSPRQSLATAIEAWGEDIPEWVTELAKACDRTSQSQVSRRLNYSSSVISQVIRKTYGGAFTSIEQMVRGQLMAEEVECPLAGPIRRDICLGHQKKATRFQPTSGWRVQLYRACKGGCIHSRLTPTLEDHNAQS